MPSSSNVVDFDIHPCVKIEELYPEVRILPDGGMLGQALEIPVQVPTPNSCSSQHGHQSFIEIYLRLETANVLRDRFV